MNSCGLISVFLKFMMLGLAEGLDLLPVLQQIPFAPADKIHRSAQNGAFCKFGLRRAQCSKENRHVFHLPSGGAVKRLIMSHDAEYGQGHDKSQ